ncbi:uncharacterized protein [Periplaneta americana]|uniref:uncharacterized protein n=1 Tax=Periplaneta americana TaxID=6978 RepID=UPI0037E82413
MEKSTFALSLVVIILIQGSYITAQDSRSKGDALTTLQSKFQEYVPSFKYTLELKEDIIRDIEHYYKDLVELNKQRSGDKVDQLLVSSLRSIISKRIPDSENYLTEEEKTLNMGREMIKYLKAAVQQLETM